MRGKINHKGEINMAKKVTGTVKWFSARRGYGFVTDGEGTDYFVHFSQIVCEGFKKLSAGQRVEFTIDTDGQGRDLATMVTPLNDEGEHEDGNAGPDDISEDDTFKERGIEAP